MFKRLRSAALAVALLFLPLNAALAQNGGGVSPLTPLNPQAVQNFLPAFSGDCTSAYGAPVLNCTKAPVLLSGNATLLASQTNEVVELTGSTSFTLTLPNPVGNAGINYRVYNNSTQPWSIATPGGFFQPEGAGTTNLSIAAESTDVIFSDGTNWITENPDSQLGGKLLNVQTFTTNGTYTPTPGTRSIIVEAVGGGGGGAGCPSQTAAQNVFCFSSGGTGGNYIRARFTSGFYGGPAVTVGTAGTAGANTAGGNGGNTSFGSLITVGGGVGSVIGTQVGAASLPYFNTNNSVGGTSTTLSGGTLIFKSAGGIAGTVVYGSGGAVGSAGGASYFGPGAAFPSYSVNGIPGVSPGSGGSGCELAYAGTSAACSGGAGGTGIVIVYEFG